MTNLINSLKQTKQLQCKIKYPLGSWSLTTKSRTGLGPVGWLGIYV